jgi:hypothetical protein
MQSATDSTLKLDILSRVHAGNAKCDLIFPYALIPALLSAEFRLFYPKEYRAPEESDAKLNARFWFILIARLMCKPDYL